MKTPFFLYVLDLKLFIQNFCPRLANICVIAPLRSLQFSEIMKIGHWVNEKCEGPKEGRRDKPGKGRPFGARWFSFWCLRFVIKVRNLWWYKGERVTIHVPTLSTLKVWQLPTPTIKLGICLRMKWFNLCLVLLYLISENAAQLICLIEVVWFFFGKIGKVSDAVVRMNRIVLTIWHVSLLVSFCWSWRLLKQYQ